MPTDARPGGRGHWHWQLHRACQWSALVVVPLTSETEVVGSRCLGTLCAHGQAPLPLLVYLKKQARSLEGIASGGTLESLRNRFQLCFEEDFSPTEVGHRDVVVFYDCERSPHGRLLVPGGSFRDVLNRDVEKSRLLVVLINEDPGLAGQVNRQRVAALGKVLTALPERRPHWLDWLPAR